MKNALNKLLKSTLSFLLSAAVISFPLAARAQTKDTEMQPEIVASGGNFTLEKAVTAGGGSSKQSASFTENGTTGQTVAGVRSTGGNYSIYSGFWTPDDFIPTASSVVVGGRILTAYGAGIRNVQITITFPSGEFRTALSSSFGYYRFTDIPVGGTYVISVASKKFTFSQPTQIRHIQDDLQDIDFIADALE